MRIVSMIGCVVLFSWCAAAQPPVDDSARARELKQVLLDYWQSIDSMECEYVQLLSGKGETSGCKKVFFKFKGDWIWHTEAVFHVEKQGPPRLAAIASETNVNGGVDTYYFGETRIGRGPFDLLRSPWNSAKGLLSGSVYREKDGRFLEKGMGRWKYKSDKFVRLYPNDFTALTIAGKSSPMGCYSYAHSLRAMLAGPCACSFEEIGGEILLNVEPEPWLEESNNLMTRYRLVFHLSGEGLLKSAEYLHYPACSQEELTAVASGKLPEQMCYPICTDSFEEYVSRNGIQIPVRMKRITWGTELSGPGARQEAMADQDKWGRGEMSQCEFELRDLARRTKVEENVNTLELLPESILVNNPALSAADFAVYAFDPGDSTGETPPKEGKAISPPANREELPEAAQRIRFEDLDTVQTEVETQGSKMKIGVIFGAVILLLIALYIIKRRV